MARSSRRGAAPPRLPPASLPAAGRGDGPRARRPGRSWPLTSLHDARQMAGDRYGACLFL